ncbi:MAG: AAA family ATPase [Clostridiales bacterium]|nr:AAA family ATPase [Clostridiales bacterium]
MKVDEIKEVSISDFFEMCEKDEGKYQIDTPDGWQEINFLVKKKNKECLNLNLENNIELRCSVSHKVFTKDGWKESKDIIPNQDYILTKNGFKKVITKKYDGVNDTFDLQVNSDESRYYSNDVVSHNCGKSLVCKAISGSWNMPLLRLDFGKLFDSLVGQSEQRARDALRLAEAISPCVLWIDEIEKGLAGVSSSGKTDGGTTSRVLSTFLTWMQEKISPVFVVATANDHASIPPEFLRAGRFDEIFFVDLPNEAERKDIFNVLLRKKGYQGKDFNIDLLAAKNHSENYSGAEIEKSITNAMLVGFQDGRRKIKTDDVLNALSGFKPLFEMRNEDFEDLREWATSRCIKANASSSEAVVLGMASNRELDLDE